jgi:hypothetical protein
VIRRSVGCAGRVGNRKHECHKVLKIEAMPTSATLTAKQAKFVNEYRVDGNGTRAAVAAGLGIQGN